MKKIFTLAIACLAAFAAQAQVTITFNGQPVQSGDVLEITPTVIDLGGGYTILDWTQDPTFTNEGTTVANLSVTVTKDYTEGPALAWCGLNNGSCLPDFPTSQNLTLALQPSAFTTMFLHPEGEVDDNIDCSVTVQVMAGFDFTSFKMHFVYSDAAGIDGLTVGTQGAKVVDGGLELPATSWSIYAIDGRLVAKGTNATTKTLPAGIYVVKCGQKSQKLLVK